MKQPALYCHRPDHVCIQHRSYQRCDKCKHQQKYQLADLRRKQGYRWCFWSRVTDCLLGTAIHMQIHPQPRFHCNPASSFDQALVVPCVEDFMLETHAIFYFFQRFKQIQVFRCIQYTHIYTVIIQIQNKDINAKSQKDGDDLLVYFWGSYICIYIHMYTYVHLHKYIYIYIHI